MKRYKLKTDIIVAIPLKCNTYTLRRKCSI